MSTCYLAQAAGTARYASNGGLALCPRRLNVGQPVPHAAELHRRWNTEKPQRSWGSAVAKCCGQEALRDLDRAFAHFWRGRPAGHRVGFPRVRRKHGRRDAFRLTGSIKVHPQSVIVGEDLSVPGMIRNRRLARSIADAGWSEFRRMLAYKTQWYGSRLVVAPRFSPSTKTCSICGHVKAKMPLSARVFRREACGAAIDRAVNAARNLAALAGSSPERQNPCGAEGSGQENGLVKPTAAKQDSPRRKLTAQAVGNKRL